MVVRSLIALFLPRLAAAITACGSGYLTYIALLFSLRSDPFFTVFQVLSYTPLGSLVFPLIKLTSVILGLLCGLGAFVLVRRWVPEHPTGGRR